MDLHVTHHALDRMGLACLPMLHYVPAKCGVKLSTPAAGNLRKLLAFMIRCIDNAKRCTFPAHIEAFKVARYGLGDVWLYDAMTANMFTFRANAAPLEKYGTNLVTVTHLQKPKRKLLEHHPDPDQCPKMKDFTALCIPYRLIPKAHCEPLPHPHGGLLPILFEADRSDHAGKPGPENDVGHPPG